MTDTNILTFPPCEASEDTEPLLRPNGPDDAVLAHQGYPELAVFRCTRCRGLVGYDHECQTSVPQCAYTALTRFGTEQCDLPVEDAESVDQDEREFCTGHCADVKRNELADYGCDDDYGVSFS